MTKRGYLGYSTVARRAIVSPEKCSSTRSFSLKDDADEAPAIGRSGAESKAQQLSHWRNTSPTRPSRLGDSPSASAGTRFLGSYGLGSRAPLGGTASLAEKVKTILRIRKAQTTIG